MKHWLFGALLAAACLAFAACARIARPDAPAPSKPQEIEDPGVPADTPLTIDALGVEFSVSGHDEDALLTLQKEFPAALIDALSLQMVEVGRVSVTFGTSGEATQIAMLDGAVQIAFLPAEDYFPYRAGMIVAHENLSDADLSTGLIVAAASDDASYDERLVTALRDALDTLAPMLAPYTADDAEGQYVFDAARLDELSRLYEEQEGKTALHGAG